MSYSSNPLLPKARADAVRLVVEQKLPITIAARKSGVHRTTLWRWYKIWQSRGYRGWVKPIPTRSSRPHHYGRAISQEIINKIEYYRRKYGRCATIVHAYCLQAGTKVSLSTVRRVLYRLGLVVRRKWKRSWRPSIPRPAVTKPGDLIQTDTVHLTSPWKTKRRAYVYTAVDTFSR